MNGNSEAIKSFNFYLKTFEQRIYDTYHELMKDKGHITCELLKNRLLGKEVRSRMLIPIFQEHNDKIEKLVGKEYAKVTLGRYQTCISHTKE